MSKPLDSFIKAYLRKWARLLGLAGWDISWKWEEADALRDHAGYEALAVSIVTGVKQTVRILVLDTEDWQTEDSRAEHYLPDALLHELVHVRMFAAEMLLWGLAPQAAPHLPPSIQNGYHDALIAVREHYTESVVGIIQGLEAKLCKS